jgi:hypothetical protein
MSNFVPPQYNASLDEALSPTRADVVVAKSLLLETLATGGATTVTDLATAVYVHEGLPVEVPYRDPVDLPPNADPAEVVRRDVPQIARARMERAVTRALAELELEGVLVPIRDVNAQTTLQVHSGNTTGGYYAKAPAPAIAGAYELAEDKRTTASELLDADLYTSDITDLLGNRGVRCVDEAFRAHRRGLHLAAVNMLGAASEAAWYSLGERLRSHSTALARALDEDRTVTVFRQVQDVVIQLRVGRSTRENMDELRSHAAYLRDLRNYGLHPRSSVFSDLEHHFTEHAAALLFMNSHRYFKRLAAIAEGIPAAEAVQVGTRGEGPVSDAADPSDTGQAP